jgi:hypothetical protein
LPARTPRGEFGIIDAARLSPNGRWIAVVDQTAPYVKVVNDSGVTSAVIQLTPGLRGEQMLWPIVAISNSSVLVFRPELREAQFFDLQGRLERTVAGIDFLPLTATAVNDSVWFVYGPSSQRDDGKANWVHCLYSTSRSPRWTSAYLDSVQQVSNSSTNVVAPFVSGDDVLLEHRQPGLAVILSTSCAPGAASSPTTVVARAPAAGYRSRPAAWGAGIARFAGQLWTISTDDAPSLSLQRVNAAGPYVLTVNGDYRIMDSRAGVGVLFANQTRAPILFRLGEDALARTVSKQ